MWEGTHYYRYQCKQSDLTLTLYEYFTSKSVRFSVSICFNVDGIFCRRRQLASVWSTYCRPISLKKGIDIAYIVAGENICFRATTCAEPNPKCLKPMNNTQRLPRAYIADCNSNLLWIYPGISLAWPICPPLPAYVLDLSYFENDTTFFSPKDHNIENY